MSAMFRACVAVGVVASALLLAGTSHARRAPKKKAPEPLSVRIVGEWTSDPFESQVGTATQVFCFRADGTAAVHTVTPTGPLSNDGTYGLLAERVTVQLEHPSASVILQASWADDRLVLTDQSGQARSYRRTAKEC